MSINTTRTHVVATMIAALALAVMVGSAPAATLVQGSLQSIGESQGAGGATNIAGVSVTPGHEGYSLSDGVANGDEGLNTGGLDQSFNNPIIDYAFYTTTGGSTAITELVGGSSSIIGTATGTGTNSSTTPQMRIWSTSVPNGAFDNYDFTDMGRPYNVTGTINISSLSSGSVYLFFGLNNSSAETTTIDLSMSGSGQTTVDPAALVLAGVTPVNATKVVRYDFSDAQNYDTITWSYVFSSTSATNPNRARFGGVVVTGIIPEPATLALLGLGGLLMIKRRKA